MKSTQLTQLELVLLKLVIKGKGQWSWYEIASHLSRLDVPREPDMMVVLKKMVADGFLNRYVESGSPRDRWKITPEGIEKLIESTQKSKTKIKPRWRLLGKSRRGFSGYGRKLVLLNSSK